MAREHYNFRMEENMLVNGSTINNMVRDNFGWLMVELQMVSGGTE